MFDAATSDENVVFLQCATVIFEFSSFSVVVEIIIDITILRSGILLKYSGIFYGAAVSSSSAERERGKKTWILYQRVRKHGVSLSKKIKNFLIVKINPLFIERLSRNIKLCLNDRFGSISTGSCVCEGMSFLGQQYSRSRSREDRGLICPGSSIHGGHHLHR